MAYDQGLAEQLRELLIEHAPTEKKMFGGLCFMVRGHMVCGVVNDRAMIRVGKGQYQNALKQRGAAPMDFTGKPMQGFVYVDPCIGGSQGLADFVTLALRFNRSLPDKHT